MARAREHQNTVESCEIHPTLAGGEAASNHIGQAVRFCQNELSKVPLSSALSRQKLNLKYKNIVLPLILREFFGAFNKRIN